MHSHAHIYIWKIENFTNLQIKMSFRTKRIHYMLIRTIMNIYANEMSNMKYCNEIYSNEMSNLCLHTCTL